MVLFTSSPTRLELQLVPWRRLAQQREHGTLVTFKPDATIFPDVDFVFDTLAKRLKELAFLNKGLKITISDERTDKSEEFCYEGGLVSFCEYMSRGRNALHPNPVALYKEIKEKDQIIGLVEVAIQWTDAYNESLASYVNNIHTPEGGTHLTGMRSALTRVVNSFAESSGLLKNFKSSITGDDIGRDSLVLLQ